MACATLTLLACGNVGQPPAGVAPDASPGLGPPDLTLEVDPNQNERAISPYVYGVNNGNRAAAHRAPIVRSGGNRLTAYNWENNASNAGSDFHFQNDNYLCSTMGGTSNDYPCSQDGGAPGAYLRAVVDQAVAAGAAVAITVPIGDYVSADKGPPGDVRADADGGPLANYLDVRFKKNGIKGGGYQNPPDTNDDSVYQDEMLNWLAQAEPAAKLAFMLDNEPDLWSATHAEVHPIATTYAEIVRRSLQYGTAIKSVLPDATVWGVVSFGWSGYVNLRGAVDAMMYGDFLNFWLDQMSAAQATAGKSLVDGLDLHWYPEAGDKGPMTSTNGGAPGSDCRVVTDPTQNNSMPPDCYTQAGLDGTAAAREQAPRSLWDETYVENSYITVGLGGQAIALIPRVMDKIAQHDPAMKLSFSEWNFGGGSDISGAIATADVLGVFGARGVDMAMLWETWHDEAFTYAAFDAYRNYDGSGAAFGDTSIAASTTDTQNSSVYASIESADPSHMVIVAINKALTDKVAKIALSGGTVYATAAVYALTQSTGPSLARGLPLSSVAANAFSYLMPAQSVSVLVPSP